MIALLGHVTTNESVSMVAVFLLGTATGSIVTWFLVARFFQRNR